MRIHKNCEHLNFNVKFLLNVGKMFEKKLLMPCFTVEGLETLVCTAIFLFAAVQAIDLPCTHTHRISHGQVTASDVNVCQVMLELRECGLCVDGAG